jgi:nucleotide-binding universal stress UspA family protein
MINELLVPLDGSTGSLRALRAAVALGEHAAIPVSVLMVTSPQLDATADIAWLDERTEGVTLRRELVVPSLDVAGTILDTAAEEAGTVLCMASHGRSGLTEAVIGSVSHEVVRRSPTPVLLVGPHARPLPSFATVEVCLDGSRVAERGVAFAMEWAALLRCTPWLVRVVPPSAGSLEPGDVTETAELQRVAHHLRDAGHDVQWDVLHDAHAAHAIAASASELGAAVVVASTHGRTGLDQVVFGSVAARIVHLAPCPVLAVGPAVEDPVPLPPAVGVGTA